MFFSLYLFYNIDIKMRNFSDVDIEPDIDFVMINTWRPCEIESSLISSKTCELRYIRQTESLEIRGIYGRFYAGLSFFWTVVIAEFCCIPVLFHFLPRKTTLRMIQENLLTQGITGIKWSHACLWRESRPRTSTLSGGAELHHQSSPSALEGRTRNLSSSSYFPSI